MSERPSAVTGAFRQPFKQQVAFFRNKLGNLVPTARWDDLRRGEHDLGFMVAGATKADLLADMAVAVDRSISEGETLGAFRKDFRAIVERRGWTGWTGEGSKKGEAWRTRVVYQTNMATSYAAGRNAQLQEGGFEFWVYKHGGSAEPRTQHLAWDGLTLPATHPFWRTHFAPNGWGCSCYVVGARSEAAARRLGGNPGQPLPEGWNEIDPKTGAPPGISKNWDYAPGDRVSDVVRAMAEKNRNWDYELAKAYMQGVPASMRDRLAQSYRSLPSVADDTRRYAQRILEDLSPADVPPYQTMGLLTAADAETVRSLSGANVAGFDFALDATAVRGIQSEFGNDGAGRRRGRRRVTQADYGQLPGILNDPDTVEDAGNEAGIPLLRYRKEIAGELFTALFGVRNNQQSLVLTALFVQP
ncbi:phage minor head protein [Marinobacter shengliensis]|uniref:phage minor head protein n=1 Tax=Marinobacter shengliensis TaxID=1389223 RepID=UPI002573D248|nr:phage minor head protein [Marinobacter shengliensis]BEH14265.1 hypothetical protein MAALD49_16330 [Marinobacter shengliensis]